MHVDIAKQIVLENISKIFQYYIVFILSKFNIYKFCIIISIDPLIQTQHA